MMLTTTPRGQKGIDMDRNWMPITLLDTGKSIAYMLDVGECNDGSPWVGDVLKDGEDADWDDLIGDVSRLQGTTKSEAARWLFGHICRLIGIDGEFTECSDCRECIKTEAASSCPLSDLDRCQGCYGRFMVMGECL